MSEVFLRMAQASPILIPFIAQWTKTACNMILKKVLKTNNYANIRLQMLFMCILLFFESLTQSFCFCFSVFVSGKWFEMTPHQAGFIDLGLFINTPNLGSRIHGAGSDVKGPELDMVTLQGASISLSARNTNSAKQRNVIIIITFILCHEHCCKGHQLSL